MHIENVSKEFIHRNQLIRLFSKFGNVTDCVLSTRYGTIQFEKPEEADLAVEGMNGYEFKGIKFDVKISVQENEAKPKKKKGPREASTLWSEINQEFNVDDVKSTEVNIPHLVLSCLGAKEEKERKAVDINACPTARNSWYPNRLL